MSTTVLDALRNAQCNFETVGGMGAAHNRIFKIAMDQLHNAIEALENGIDPNGIIQEGMFAQVDTGSNIVDGD